MARPKMLRPFREAVTPDGDTVVVCNDCAIEPPRLSLNLRKVSRRSPDGLLRVPWTNGFSVTAGFGLGFALTEVFELHGSLLPFAGNLYRRAGQNATPLAGLADVPDDRTTRSYPTGRFSAHLMHLMHFLYRPLSEHPVKKRAISARNQLILLMG